MMTIEAMRAADAEPAVPDDLRWRAVLARDRRWDGRFVFAVRSTRVYCRPSCPARRPRRANVRFFLQPEAAERAGFRSCRRCRPREAEPAADANLVERACRAIERSPGGPLRLDGLARGVGVAPRRLRRAFLDLLGLTPRQYAAARRLSDFKNGIRKGDNVTGALYDAGYGSSSRLYEDVQERLGMTPAVYRRGAAGVRIAFTTADSPLGRVLVGATERGIAAVALGDSDAGLEAALRAEYPRADIERDDAALAAAVRVVLQAVAGEAPAEDLPLDLQATAFQHRVWRELRRIPRGQTRSYGEIARRIGRPAAARAVARACATNRVALLVPCHRVVPGAGGTGGYRWGAERKRRLLEGEGAATPASRRRG